jgi:hypothetical protein
MPVALSAPTKAQRCHTANGHEPRHLGRGFGLVDEHQPEDVDLRLRCLSRREPQAPLGAKTKAD